MNEKLEKLNQEIEKTEKKLRRAQHEEKILGAVHNDRPETLLASALAFPAKAVVRYPPPFIEEERQFQLPLFRHSRHGASLNKNPPISAVTAAIDG